MPLAFLFVVAAIAFWQLSHNSLYQIIIAVGVAVAYVFWGVVHHYLAKDLDVSIVIEYVVIGTLGLVVLFSLLLN